MIGRDLRLARIYYFVWIGALGFSNPFVNLFYAQQGLSGAEIGLVITFGALVGLFVAPLWGRWTDGGVSIIRLLQIALVGIGILLIVLSQQVTFIEIAAVASLIGVFGAGIGPMSDNLALRISAARRAGYGSIRVFGSAGWAITVLFSGWLIDRLGLVAGFVGSGIGFIASAGLLFFIPNVPASTGVPAHSKQEHGLRAAARELIGIPALLGLAIAIVVRGILTDGSNQFGNIYLRELGASTAIIGIASMVGAVVELGGFVIADRVVKRIGSTRTLLISFFLSGVKFVLVLAFPAVWSVLATRAFEGIGFSLYVIGLIAFVTERASPSHTGTMLALYTVTFIAIIQIVAAPFEGIFFDVFGAYWLYALALVGNFLGLAILFGFSRNRQKKPEGVEQFIPTKNSTL